MTSLRSSARGRAGAIAIGAAVIGSLALAGPSLANPPSAGVNCQANGKILGRGATFQRNAQLNAFIPGFRQDVCGPVSDAINTTDMVLYNDRQNTTPLGLETPTWPGPTTDNPGLTQTMGTGPRNGSGAGIIGNECRSEAFEGTDTPYSNAQLALTRGIPVLSANCATLNSDTLFNPVYEPGAVTSTFPDAADTAAVSPQAGTSNGAMTFPVAGGAIALGANLSSTECPGIAGTRPVINFTGTEVSAVFGGTITSWDDPALVATSPELANCVGVPIIRVVRTDSSGTSQQFRNYLAKVDPAAAPNPRICDPAVSWPTLKAGANTIWPQSPSGTCPATGGGSLIRPAGNGGQALIQLTDTTVGAVGYADLSDWQASGVTIALSNVAAATGGAFVAPAAGTGSNCSFAGATLPGTGSTGAVGLSPANLNWATNAGVVKSDVTFIGAGYPICAFTYEMVYTGLDGNTAGVNPISRMNANQKRTLFSYITYVLSPAAQGRLSSIGYAQLPTSFRSQIALGFNLNY